MRKKTPAELDLRRLQQLARKTPRTKAGQVRQAWPQIQLLIANGHTLKEVLDCLREIGIDLPYSRFCEYVRELQRTQPAQAAFPTTAPVPPVAEPPGPAILDRNSPDFDPLFNVKRHQANRPGFDYQPFRIEDTEKLTGIKPRD